MTQSPSPQPGRNCGACGALVAADAVTCPACGAYLAAYEVATGAGQGLEPASGSVAGELAQSSATAAVPSAQGATTPVSFPASSQQPPSTMPNLPTDPATHPERQGPSPDAARPRSPIADAMRELQEDDTPGDLSDMASGNDLLAEMAAGDDDDLARMAAGGGLTLKEQIDAQLSGARINYSGSRPEIVPNPETDAPEEVTDQAGSRTAPTAPKPASPKTDTRAASPKSSAPQRVQATPVAPGTAPLEPVSTSSQVQARSGDARAGTGRAVGKRAGSPPSTQAAKNVPWAVVGVVGCVLFSMLSRAGATGVLLFVVIVVLVVGWLVMRMAGMTGRKSTHMPRDPNDWGKPRR